MITMGLVTTSWIATPQLKIAARDYGTCGNIISSLGKSVRESRGFDVDRLCDWTNAAGVGCSYENAGYFVKTFRGHSWKGCFNIYDKNPTCGAHLRKGQGKRTDKKKYVKCGVGRCQDPDALVWRGEYEWIYNGGERVCACKAKWHARELRQVTSLTHQ